MPQTLTVSDARADLYRLVDQTADNHQPVTITGKRSNAVLISEDDWNALQETLYLVNIPGMRQSIRTGLRTPVKKCLKKLVW